MTDKPNFSILLPTKSELLSTIFRKLNVKSSSMEHRHINTKNDEWGVAIIHSIWERGSEDDICALIREVKRNAKAADAVRRAISHSKVYGWPKFFKMYLEKIYGRE